MTIWLFCILYIQLSKLHSIFLFEICTIYFSIGGTFPLLHVHHNHLLDSFPAYFRITLAIPYSLGSLSETSISGLHNASDSPKFTFFLLYIFLPFIMASLDLDKMALASYVLIIFPCLQSFIGFKSDPLLPNSDNTFHSSAEWPAP